MTTEIEISQMRKEALEAAKHPIKIGMILFIVVFVGLGGWGLLAKIDKAAISLGQIAPAENNKVVQHLEGGIIEKILVKEGDKVKAGDVLVRLSRASVEANATIAEGAFLSSQAEYYRLLAEKDNKQKIEFPAEWQQPENVEKYKQVAEAQNQIFYERRNALIGRIKILEERNSQMQNQISGTQSQISSNKRQLVLIEDELKAAETLLASGNTTKSRVLAIKRGKAQLEGSIGELTSSIARIQDSISENKLTIVNQKNEYINEVVEKLKEVQKELNESRERASATSDMLARTEIRAPINGIIKGMKFKTESGVIAPGAEILTIVPTDDNMIAEVRINPNDIDVVHVGMQCKVRITAYSSRSTPALFGELLYVSADSFIDERTNQRYYSGKVSIDMTKLTEKEKAKTQLYPGMPVEVFIKTGARSPISYLLEPLFTTFRRSFREE
jgi:HlyD family type I secretion membrane fusion protein